MRNRVQNERVGHGSRRWPAVVLLMASLGCPAVVMAQEARPRVASNSTQLEKIAADVPRLSVMKLTATDLPKLSRFTELRNLHITISEMPFGAKEGRILAGLSKLESLSIVQVRIESGFFKELGKLPLKSLSLYCDYADDAWSGLAGLPSLETLWLKEPEFDAETMTQLVAAAPGLKSFALVSDVSITSKALLPLKNLKSLRKLDLSRTEGVNSEVVIAAVNGKPIEDLSLSGCRNVDGKAVAALRTLAPKLRHLAIDGTVIQSGEMAALIRDMPNLTDLSIGGSGFKPVVFEPQLMAAVMSRQHLRRLALVHFEKINLADLEPLKRIKLEELSLYGGPFDVAALKEMFKNGPRRLRLPNGRVINLR